MDLIRKQLYKIGENTERLSGIIVKSFLRKDIS